MKIARQTESECLVASIKSRFFSSDQLAQLVNASVISCGHNALDKNFLNEPPRIKNLLCLFSRWPRDRSTLVRRKINQSLM